MANRLINMAVNTSTFGAELITAENAEAARSLLDVGGGGGGQVASVNGQVGAVVLDYEDVGAASAAQGAKADTALQPGDATGAITSVNGQTGVVVLGASDVGAATAAQGAKADTALQPGDIPEQSVTSVNGKTGAINLVPSDIGAATSAQGAKADSAVQPGSLATVATSGSYLNLIQVPTHTSGPFSARPSAPVAGSTYYATDYRETYRYTGSSWELVSQGGVILASVAVESGDTDGELKINNHDFGNIGVIPGSPSLVFTCGARPFVLSMIFSLRAPANETCAVVLAVNGTNRTQQLYIPQAANNWACINKQTKPLSFAAGTTITAELKAVVGGSSPAAIFTNPADPLIIEARSV